MRVNVHANNGIHAFEAEPGEPLLYAALRQGVQLPYECGTGTCGTCRGRVRGEGTVVDRWPDAPGGKRLKREKGDVLMCQGRAAGDCDIVVPADIVAMGQDQPRAVWRRGRLTRLRRLTHDVAAFDLELDAPMDFEAGQFAALEVAGLAGFRAYSMVNYERAARRLELVVKRKPGGGFSEWLFSPASEGAELTVLGPLGKAVFRPAEDRHVLCIAGGSGIAGMMSILARGVGEGYFAGHRGDMFFGTRTMRDVFYGEELARLAGTAPGAIGVTIALSDEDPPAASPYGPAVRLERGLVHEVAQRAMAGRYDNVVAFVAGPAPMVDGALKVLHTEARLPRQFVRYDKFG